MGLIILILLIPVSISAVAAYFISAAVRNKMLSAAKPNAKGISIATFIGSFLIILIAICLILVFNIRITR